VIKCGDKLLWAKQNHNGSKSDGGKAPSRACIPYLKAELLSKKPECISKTLPYNTWSNGEFMMKASPGGSTPASAPKRGTGRG
jgi:hypothetical protein